MDWIEKLFETIDKRHRHKYYPSKSIQKIIGKPKFDDLYNIKKKQVRKYELLIKKEQKENENCIVNVDDILFYNEQNEINNERVLSGDEELQFDLTDSDNDVVEAMENDGLNWPSKCYRKRKRKRNIDVEMEHRRKKIKLTNAKNKNKHSDKQEMDYCSSDDEEWLYTSWL